jgi:hypothetical protein
MKHFFGLLLFILGVVGVGSASKTQAAPSRMLAVAFQAQLSTALHTPSSSSSRSRVTSPISQDRQIEG